MYIGEDLAIAIVNSDPTGLGDGEFEAYANFSGNVSIVNPEETTWQKCELMGLHGECFELTQRSHSLYIYNKTRHDCPIAAKRAGELFESFETVDAITGIFDDMKNGTFEIFDAVKTLCLAGGLNHEDFELCTHHCGEYIKLKDII